MTPLRLALYALAAVLMVPALMMLADAWCWIVIGYNLTGYEWWQSGRLPIAVLLLFVGAVAASIPAGTERG